MSLADRLAPIEVTTPGGQKVRLGELWRDRTVVLTFVRHFGCLFCREQVTELALRLREIRHMGAELVVIGSGEPRYARAFVEDHRIEFPVLVDPDLVSYRAAALRRGALATVGPQAIRNAMRALRKGSRPGLTQGSQWQQGGVFIISPAGETVYQYISRSAGDHPAVEDVVGALRRQAAPPPGCPAHVHA